MLSTTPGNTSPGRTSSAISTGRPAFIRPRLFSRKLAEIQPASGSMKVMTGWPAATNWPPASLRLVTSPTVGAVHGGVGEVELRPLERRQGGPELRVVLALRAELLARLLELRLGLARAGLRALELAPRLVGARLGVDAALDELEDPGRLLLRVGELGAGVRDRRLGGRDAGRVGADRLAGAVDRGLRLADRHLVGLRIDAEEQVPALHHLVVDDRDLDHVARDLGRDADDVGLHRGVGAVGGEPVGDQVVGEDRQAHRQDDPDPAPRTSVRRHGCPSPPPFSISAPRQPPRARHAQVLVRPRRRRP